MNVQSNITLTNQSDSFQQSKICLWHQPLGMLESKFGRNFSLSLSLSLSLFPHSFIFVIRKSNKILMVTFERDHHFSIHSPSYFLGNCWFTKIVWLGMKVVLQLWLPKWLQQMQSAVLLGTLIQNAVPIAFTIQNAIAFAFVLQCRMP